MALDERTAKALVKALDRLSAATEQSNKLSAAILKASGNHPNYQPPQQASGNVDPMAAFLESRAASKAT